MPADRSKYWVVAVSWRRHGRPVLATGYRTLAAQVRAATPTARLSHQPATISKRVPSCYAVGRLGHLLPAVAARHLLFMAPDIGHGVTEIDAYNGHQLFRSKNSHLSSRSGCMGHDGTNQRTKQERNKFSYLPCRAAPMIPTTVNGSLSIRL